jgi:putative ABC transport system substrate-binding protein
MAALGAAAAWPIAARAGRASNVPRIGLLWANSAEEEKRIGFVATFHTALSELGYVEGRNLLVEERFGDGNREHLEQEAADLVGLEVDLIVTGAEGVPAAHRVTTLTPIVSAAYADLVGTGLAASLAHPGGNVTGIDVFAPELLAKRLELLKRVLPRLRRAGLLSLKGFEGNRLTLAPAADVAKAMGVSLAIFEVSDAATYKDAFASASAAGFDGFVMSTSARFEADAAILASLAGEYRLPTVGAAGYATRGGLLGYGVDYFDGFRRAATFVDMILKGAKPGDIPIERASRFRTVVNLKAAAALGIEIPPTVLASADEVIE